MGHMKRATLSSGKSVLNFAGTEKFNGEMTLAHDSSASGGLRVPLESSSSSVSSNREYFLPHHGVLKPDSTTTK